MLDFPQVAKFIVSFASPEFAPSLQRLMDSAVKFKIDIRIPKTPEDLMKTEFFKENLEIFRHRRGFGYWLWKPYYIWETLQKVDDDDLVVYSDAGVEIIGNLEPLFEIAKVRQPIVAFGVGKHLNRTWTKRDCFVALDCDSEAYWNAGQWNGFFQVFRKTAFVMEFVERWLQHSRDYRLISDAPNVLGKPNLPDFRDHRHDQSIFSLLAEKAKLEKFRDPSQWGNFLKLPSFRTPGEFIEHPYAENPLENSHYGSLLNHHRERLR